MMFFAASGAPDESVRDPARVALSPYPITTGDGVNVSEELIFPAPMTAFVSRRIPGSGAALEVLAGVNLPRTIVARPPALEDRSVASDDEVVAEIAPSPSNRVIPVHRPHGCP